MKSIVEKAREIVTKLYERNMVSWNDLDREVVFAIQALNAEVQRMEALAQPAPVQEPVAWMEMVVANLVREGVNKHKARELAEHFYITPPQREWVGLTDDDIQFIYADSGYNDIEMFARAIEAKLKERNHD